MNSSIDELTGVLNTLIGVCRDSHNVFRTAAERTQDFELRAFLSDCARLRSNMIDDLLVAQRELSPELSDSESDGGMTQVWNESPIAFADADDVQQLTNCRRGEESAVAEFRDAVEHELPPETAALVRRQFAVVVATCERLRSLEKSCPPKSH